MTENLLSHSFRWVWIVRRQSSMVTVSRERYFPSIDLQRTIFKYQIKLLKNVETKMKLRVFLSLKKKIKPIKITTTRQILLISYQNQTGNHKRQKQSPGRILWKNVLKNFAKFTEKHLCWSFFFNKVLGL